MNVNDVNKDRRRFFLMATSVMGGVGTVAALVPFISSMQPSAKDQAVGAPIEVDISKLEPGQMMTVEWRGKPVWILRRTKEIIDNLGTLNDVLRDPKSESSTQPTYAANQHRSINPEYLVVIGVCTHLGCAPIFRPDLAPLDLGPIWKGGFFCPCHGSRFDLAGRVFEGVPALLNLEVPPYYYLDKTRIIVGQDLTDSSSKNN
ncbi:Ubiquinol-cytochrome c reductase iron-sulfur subunit [Gammaproteobacteria bacterium]